ncbi:oleate-activated transcription factor OAF1 NDAI_0H01990 [Naumovozyma dairenensis CBS 421]|uniref:Zn(2)-C6 fungal-type domain-containing protein n=1 Tax=Naumovozyma dairenensis (strain ATCC 10597 / BCRC 20456 / CBS 421 / NBRC 0211 / NRRL Y-12639) TaxID=1071378 RepID=G0WF12_NAUDC|nr:hypothetical protein NDAI_0H01990 [Naumovozyma dairenensis CBS 421]CCD26373.1 hypothetical protein NDAI_0H01990 [Naumovozyma dairenensis CBS 421]
MAEQLKNDQMDTKKGQSPSPQAVIPNSTNSTSISTSFSQQNDTSPRSNSGSSSSHYNAIKKRNRISFVCQECRKAKTKCDKEKPYCTRCVKQNIKCIYDVAEQPAPRIPSKDAKISRLEKDVEYWKNKAMKLLNEKELETTSLKNRTTASPSFFSASTSSTAFPESKKRNIDQLVTVEDQTDKNDDPKDTKKINNNKKSFVPVSPGSSSSIHNGNIDNHTRVNLYRNNPTMIMSKVMKREVKPLSENYIIIQDKFVSTLISSVFLDPSKNAMIPALTANANISRTQPGVTNNVLKLKEMLIKQCQNDAQKMRVNDFTDRILQNTNSTKNLKVGMILSMLYNTVGHQQLEDHCSKDGEYSELLKNFIKEFEQLLPPFNIIQRYKSHFIEYVYPNLPFLEQEMFENSISQTVLPDPHNPNKVKLNLGHNQLRSKLENLCLLLVILKLSFISLKLVEDSSQLGNLYLTKDMLEKYPISNDSILLAQRCLASENWCACTNENIITCLLYIWSFFVFSPEEGDFFLEHPTDVIGSMIMMLATSIGLHRDPSDFPQLHDSTLSNQRILNHRRMLWIGIVTICCFESSLKGRHSVSSFSLMDLFIDVHDPNAIDKYIARVKKEAHPSMDSKLISIHEYSFKRAQLALFLSDLDDLTMTYKGDFPLADVENLRDKISDFIEVNFPIVDLDKYMENKNTDINISLLSSINSTAVHSRIMFKLMMLRTSAALFLHFESKLAKDKTLLPYYYRYFTKTCTYALSLIRDFNKFFKGEYNTALSPLTSYNITKFIQLALPSTIFSLLGIILRISLGGNMLFSQYQEYPNKQDFVKLDEINKKIENLNSLHKELEIALENIHSLASEYLRFTFFSVFKMLALCDVIIQRMRKGELWLGIFGMVHTNQIHARIVKTLTMTIGFEVDKKDKLIDDLKMKNYIVDFTMDDITELRQKILYESEGIERYQRKQKPTNMDNTMISTNQSSQVSLNPPQTTMPLQQQQETPMNNNSPSFTLGLIPSSGLDNQNNDNNGFSSIAYNWNSSLGNLQKLSSAAIMTQNMNNNNNNNNNKNTTINGFESSGPNTGMGNTPTPGPIPIQGTIPISGPYINGGVPNGRNSMQTTPGPNIPLQSVPQVQPLQSQPQQQGTQVPQADFPGFFGGLDLFDYDFLFGNEFT